MADKEMRNFALRDAEGNEIGVFTGKSPRQAALKAANRGYTDIKLRERGTKKVHVFTGERVQVEKPAGAPDWMPDKDLEAKGKEGRHREARVAYASLNHTIFSSYHTAFACKDLVPSISQIFSSVSPYSLYTTTSINSSVCLIFSRSGPI
jgi:hypothetical protein